MKLGHHLYCLCSHQNISQHLEYGRKDIKWYSVHVGNVKSGTQNDEFLKLFCEAGKVVNVFIQPQSDGSTSTFGFARYATMQEALNAVDLLDGWPLHGRNLRVSLSKHQPGMQSGPTYNNSTRNYPDTNIKQGPKYNQKYVDILKNTMQDLDLAEDFPLLIEELKGFNCTLPQVYKYKHNGINLNMKLLDNLVNACEEDTGKSKTPIQSQKITTSSPIGRLYSSKKQEAGKHNSQTNSENNVKLNHKSPVTETISSKCDISNDKSPGNIESNNMFSKDDGSRSKDSGSKKCESTYQVSTFTSQSVVSPKTQHEKGMLFLRSSQSDTEATPTSVTHRGGKQKLVGMTSKSESESESSTPNGGSGYTMRGCQSKTETDWKSPPKIGRGKLLAHLTQSSSTLQLKPLGRGKGLLKHVKDGNLNSNNSNSSPVNIAQNISVTQHVQNDGSIKSSQSRTSGMIDDLRNGIDKCDSSVVENANDKECVNGDICVDIDNVDDNVNTEVDSFSLLCQNIVSTSLPPMPCFSAGPDGDKIDASIVGVQPQNWRDKLFSNKKVISPPN